MSTMAPANSAHADALTRAVPAPPVPVRGYHATIAVVLVALPIAVLLCVRVGASVTVLPLLSMAGLLAILWGAHRHYRARGDTQRLGEALGALALLIASGAAAGAISQLGLALHRPLIDPWLATIDRATGFASNAVTADLAASPVRIALLGAAYLSSFPLIFLSAVVLALRGSREALWGLIFSFAAAIVLCAGCAALFPAIGAFPYLGLAPDVAARLPAGAGVYHLPAFDHFRGDGPITLDMLKLQGVVTFPSFHTALAWMTAFAWRQTRPIFMLMLAWNALVIVSTIPIGGHYGIDLLAGTLLWAAIHWWVSTRTGSASPENQAGPIATTPTRA